MTVLVVKPNITQCITNRPQAMITLSTCYRTIGSSMLVVEQVNFMSVEDKESEYWQVISVLAVGYDQ